MTDRDPVPYATDPTNDYAVTPEPHCIACGRHHGGVNERIRCLENALIRAHNELAPYKAIRAGVEEMNRRYPSRVGERGR